MQEAGKRPPKNEIEMYHFMNKRQAAFERNELDVEGLKRLIGLEKMMLSSRSGTS